MTAPPDWHAADRAYQLHHTDCPTCRAAGANPNHLQRCPYRGASVSASFQRAAKLLELNDITLHDLRHEGISRLFEAGLSIPEVSLISGHTSWESLKRYTHIQPKHVLEKLAKPR